MIRQRIGSTFALVVLLFAFVGFGYKLANDPGSLFSQLLFFAITAGIIFLLFKFLTRNSVNSSTNSQYQKSVAQSKKMYAKNNPSPRRTDFKKKPVKTTKTAASSKVRPLRDRSKAPHLTVIEGKKGKKKKRAF